MDELENSGLLQNRMVAFVRNSIEKKRLHSEEGMVESERTPMTIAFQALHNRRRRITYRLSLHRVKFSGLASFLAFVEEV
jgi:hypothetical protein